MDTPKTATPITAETLRDEINFTCGVCGVMCNVAPNPPERAVCPAHCQDHEYKHDPWRRHWFCEICDEQAPDDYLEPHWEDER